MPVLSRNTGGRTISYSLGDFILFVKVVLCLAFGHTPPIDLGSETHPLSFSGPTVLFRPSPPQFTVGSLWATNQRLQNRGRQRFPSDPEEDRRS